MLHRSLLVGDFASAVDLALASEDIAGALMFAIAGGYVFCRLLAPFYISAFEREFFPPSMHFYCPRCLSIELASITPVNLVCVDLSL